VPLEVGIDVGPLLHHDLHKGPSLGRLFPRRGALACREPHDHVTDAALLAGLDLDVARDVVALVEQPEHCHPVGHRRADPARGDHRRRGARQLLGDLGRFGFLLGRFVGARGEQQQRGRESGKSHASGVHAS